MSDYFYGLQIKRPLISFTKLKGFKPVNLISYINYFDDFFKNYFFNLLKEECLSYTIKPTELILNIQNWVTVIVYKNILSQLHSTEFMVFKKSSNIFYLSTVHYISLINYLVITLIILTTTYCYFFSVFFINSNNVTYTGVSLYSYLDDVEEEFGQLEDFITYITVFLFIIFFFFFFNFFQRFFILEYYTYFFTTFLLIGFIGLFTPLETFKRGGLSFVQYIRGSGKSTFLLAEIILDFISASVVVIRFLIQNVRFVFIFVTLFEYYEFISLNLNNFLLNFIQFSNPTNLDLFFFVKIISNFFLYLYYVGHLTVIYISQLSVYFILSFWIFFFLYTAFINTCMEKYFISK